LHKNFLTLKILEAELCEAKIFSQDNHS